MAGLAPKYVYFMSWLQDLSEFDYVYLVFVFSYVSNKNNFEIFELFIGKLTGKTSSLNVLARRYLNFKSMPSKSSTAKTAILTCSSVSISSIGKTVIYG